MPRPRFRDDQWERIYAILRACPGIYVASGGGDPSLRRGGAVDGAGGLRVAAGAGRGRQLEQRVQAVRALAGEGCLGGADGSSGGRRRSRVGDARQHRGAGPRLCRRGKKIARRASAWPLARRLLQQAARSRRRPGQPAGLPPDRRAAGRRPASPAPARPSHDHSGDRRQGLRHRRHPAGRGGRAEPWR